MKEEFLNFILCPICKSANFALQIQSKNDIEIRDGQLLCRQCQAIFLIKNGIVFFDKNLTPSAEKEKIFAEKDMEMRKDVLAFQNEQWLLNLSPEAKLATDERSQRIAQISLENALMALKYFHWPIGMKILDLGAGKCWLTAKLAEQHQCVALDILVKFPHGLEAADVFMKHNYVFFERVAVDMIELPFKDNSFDIVLTNAALHHSPNLLKTLREVYRVLTPEGKVILLSEPCLGWFGRQERKSIEEEKVIGLNEQRYTLKEWINNFRMAGFHSFDFFLPFNISNVLKTRGGFFRILGIIINIMPALIRNIMVRRFSKTVLTIFDGFFNAIIYK